MGKADKRKRFPFPEALPGERGGKWDIKERAVQGSIGGLCNPAGREMHVPLGPTPQERNIRKHELLHAAFSPGVIPSDPAAHPEFVQVAEDARIQNIGSIIGIDWAPGGFDLEEKRKALVDRACSSKALEDDRLLLIKILCARWGTPDYATWRSAIRRKRAPEMKALACRANLILRQHLPQFLAGVSYQECVTITLAIALTKAFLPVQDLTPDPKGQDSPKDKSGDPAGSKPTPAAQEQATRELRERIKKAGSIPPPSQTCRSHPSLPLWGKMHIQTPPLVQSLRARIKSVAWRPATEGTGIRYPQRWLSDRAIFALKRHQVGGTVVIDTSGSMSLEPPDVLKILLSAPAATVACYAGTFHGEPKGGSGVLRILASGGRRVADSFVACPSRGKNCIDGPVLAWLATQKGPRLWISDGVVVGAGGDRSPEHVADANRLLKAGRIFRVEKPDLAGDILAFIQRKGR